MNNENINKGSENFQNTQEIKTFVVSDDSDNSQVISEILRATTVTSDASEVKSIHFYLAGESQPIEMNVQDVIRIGRMEDASHIASLNLRDYHGAVLGVSRYHAEIVRKDGAYYVKDMGSTNGTWINNAKIPPYRLKPLQDTDQLRLGHLNIVVQFTS